MPTRGTSHATRLSHDGGAVQRSVVSWYRTHRRPLPWRTHIDLTRDSCLGLPCPDTPVLEILEGRHPVTSVTPYAIWVSEIMSQQTQIATLIPYWLRWMHRLPNVQALAQCDLGTVKELWAGLGYYRRASYLHRGAQHILQQHNGTVPRDMRELLRVPGIGPYTAGAIASVCFGLKVPVVDGNVLRVLCRLAGLRDADVKSKLVVEEVTRLATTLIEDCRVPGDFNQGLMDIGARICKPNGPPLCGDCPLSSLCAAKVMLEKGDIPQIETVIPLVSKRITKRCERAVSLVCRRKEDGLILLSKRPEHGGLLAGMWQVPQHILPDATEPSDVSSSRSVLHQALIGSSKARPVAERRLVHRGVVKHLFSHITYQTDVFDVECDTATCSKLEKAIAGLDPSCELRWIAPDLAPKLALSKIASKILALIVGAGPDRRMKRSRS